MSPRITGTLCSLAVLSACGSNPPALTSSPQAGSSFSVQQCGPIAGTVLSSCGASVATGLVPFSYFGLGYGGLGLGGLGLGGLGGFGGGLLGGAYGIVPPAFVPIKYGAIGSALPYGTSPGAFGGLGIGGLGGYGGLGFGGLGGYSGLGFGGLGGLGVYGAMANYGLAGSGMAGGGMIRGPIGQAMPAAPIQQAAPIEEPASPAAPASEPAAQQPAQGAVSQQSLQQSSDSQ
jgi:hypothetical protein